MSKKSYTPLIASIAVAIGLLFIANKQKGVGKMSDPAVALSGKLTNGKQYSNVYPITPEVAAELKQMGVPTV